MSEKIESITETSFKESEDAWSNMAGFVVKTTEQEIKLGISDYQSCCESWGYFMSEDNINEFVGAELLEMKITDTARNTTKFNDEVPGGVYDGDVMFVDLVTDKGTLQFVAYNSHNGYYGHTAVVQSKQLTHSATL